jgi:hypothetical protein
VKIEDRLRRELNDTAEHLALNEDTYEHVLDLGRRRHQSRRLAAAAGTAMVIAVVAGLLALRPFGAPVPIVSLSTTTTSVPVTTTKVTLAPTPAIEGVVMATPGKGIVISGLDGTMAQLTSDLYYESVAWVISDDAGGIIFQHEVTPLPWTQGTILHLPADGSKPGLLVAPDPGTYIRPLDTDSGLLIYRVDAGGTSEVRTIDLQTKAIQTVIPPTEFLIAASSDDGILISAFGGDCPRLEIFNLDGTAPQAPPWGLGECQTGSINDLTFSGGYVFTIEDSEGRSLVRREFATGQVSTTLVDDAWSVAALPDGTVAVGGSDIVIGTYQGDSFFETLRMSGGTSFTLAEVGGFPGEATLGSGSGELPCTPIEVPPVSPQGLPQPVEDQRLLIFKMAASCDLVGLAELAVADGTAFSYGGETDPLRSWIRSARNGFDVMMWIVRVFNSVPAIDETGTYAWPAVHATNSEEDWQELSGILSAAEYEQYSRSRESGWLGLRIGIAEDGGWSYVVAGD